MKFTPLLSVKCLKLEKLQLKNNSLSHASKKFVLNLQKHIRAINKQNNIWKRNNAKMRYSALKT